MSRAKRTRKSKMARRQAARAKQLEKRLEEARAHFNEMRERSLIRGLINESDLPEPVKFVVGSLIDPAGTVNDMIRRQIQRGGTGA